MFPQGQTYADYQLLSGVLQPPGAMGEVYKALHVPTQKIVALKFTKLPHDKHWYKRFKEENKYLHQLSPHDNIIKAHSHVTHDGQHAFYSMEFLEQGLESYLGLLSSGDDPKKLDLFKQICRGLQHAHANHVYHRDLHPGNIRMDADIPKLVDFGLGKDEHATTDSFGLLTWLGAVTTPEAYFYISDNPTHDDYVRRDTYALGVVLHTIFAASNLPFRMAVQTDMLTHMVGLGFNPNLPAYYNAYLGRFDEAARNAHYQAWLKGVDPKILDHLTVSIADINLGKKLTLIIKKACDMDHTKRYATVADVIKAIEGL